MVDLVGLASLGREQHGLVHRSQALACGLTPNALQRWAAGGRLERVWQSVYRSPGAPVSWEQRLLAAVLACGPGAVASHSIGGDRVCKRQHRSGRRGRGDGAVRAGARPPGRHRAPLHRPPRHRRGVAPPHPGDEPVAQDRRPGAVVAGWEVEDALDRALACRLVTVAGVERALDDVARRGRNGAGVLRAVLDGRALGRARPDSLLEPRMARVLRGAGVPAQSFQYHVRDGGRFVARVDFAYPDVRLAIEVDGFDSHSSPRALQSDLERQNRLAVLGWTVLRFTWADVVASPSKVG